MTDHSNHMAKLAANMRLAARMNPWNGATDARGMAIMERCRSLDYKTGASLLFSFDYGAHTSGWWKNPDYDRCFHLSIASLALLFETHAETARIAGRIPELTGSIREAWALAFFEETKRLLWIEPPYSEHGRALQTYHYRVFVDANGVPILPRGEVYSRELTEAGWKSWSEVHAPVENEEP